MSDAPLTARIVERCLGDVPSRVDGEALSRARRCLVDSLAVAIAASGERPIAILRRVSADGRGPAEASLIGSGERVSADTAALVNGMMVSLLLFDDNHATMRGHPSAPVLPAVLALAEAADLGLEEALTAFVVGYEVECRLGIALNPSHYEIGWHATATQGTMGAIVAAALLMGLDAETTARALGIAGSLAGGLRANFGTMTMSLHSGEAASAGVRAARMASLGFSADPDIFGGDLSFGRAFSREWNEAAFTEQVNRWGAPFAIVDPGPIFKIYPCGRPTLPAVDCVMELRRRYGIGPADIAEIECSVSYMYPRTLIHSRPTSGLQGKTSLEYCVAAAFVDDGPRFSSFTDAAVRRPEIAALIDRISVRIPPELSEDVPEVRRRPFEQPVTLTVRTTDGATYSETVTDHRGTPMNPATDDDLRRKFLACAAGHLDAGRADAILACIERDDVGVRELFALVNG